MSYNTDGSGLILYRMRAMEIIRGVNNGSERSRILEADRTSISLPDTDDDHNLIGHDRQTETTFPTFNKNVQILTSCRVGSVHAVRRLFGMHELPISGESYSLGFYDIKVSSFRLTEGCSFLIQGRSCR